MIIKSADFFIFSDDPWEVACPDTSRWKRLEKLRTGPIHTLPDGLLHQKLFKKQCLLTAPTEMIIKSADFFIFSDDPWGVACPDTSRWKRLEKLPHGTYSYFARRPSASKVIQKTVLAHRPTEMIIKSADFFIFSDDPWGVACPETSRWKRLEKLPHGTYSYLPDGLLHQKLFKKQCLRTTPPQN
jgi:hypothetical protein